MGTSATGSRLSCADREVYPDWLCEGCKCVNRFTNKANAYAEFTNCQNSECGEPKPSNPVVREGTYRYKSVDGKPTKVYVCRPLGTRGENTWKPAGKFKYKDWRLRDGAPWVHFKC